MDVSFRKADELEKCGQDMKKLWTFILKYKSKIHELTLQIPLASHLTFGAFLGLVTQLKQRFLSTVLHSEYIRHILESG